MTAKREANMVMGIRHFRRSMVLDRTDLPLTVIRSFLPITTFIVKSRISESKSRKAEITVASVRPWGVPVATYSEILVVTV